MIAPRFGVGSSPSNDHQGGAVMGAKTDQLVGRAKQGVGAITRDEDLKAEGQAQEDAGKIEGKIDSAADKAKESLEGLKKAVKHK
jgi:uncharacterized protein YjbJ (UPF0337 family)